MLHGLSLLDLVEYIVCILISLVLHEFMHAYTGYLLGDETAKRMGRVSLNPLDHIDPFMTVALPIASIILFGVPVLAAKPVPFDPRNLKYDEYGSAIVSAAGPLTNLVLAIIGSLILHLVSVDGFMGHFISLFVILNVAVFIFNLIPIPPLDGSRVLYAFAPEPVQRVMDQIEPFGLMIVFILVLGGGAGGLLTHLIDIVLNLLP